MSFLSTWNTSKILFQLLIQLIYKCAWNLICYCLRTFTVPYSMRGTQREYQIHSPTRQSISILRGNGKYCCVDEGGGMRVSSRDGLNTHLKGLVFLALFLLISLNSLLRKFSLVITYITETQILIICEAKYIIAFVNWVT